MPFFEKRIASGADDVEQLTSNGNMFLTSSDLDMVVDGSAGQLVGLRFTALNIPLGAVITAAYIQFQADERGTGATSLLIRGLDSDDASPFTNRYFDLSSRVTTSASAIWQPQAWTIIDETGAAQRTSDLSALVQEIVNRTGWQAGNDLGFVISGSGARTADSYEGGSAKAPLLHIEYTLSSQNAGPVIDLDASAAGLGYVTVFSANGAAVAIADSDVLITDPDDASMERLTVIVSNAKAGDQLLISGALPNGIAIDPGSTSTALIFSGLAPATAYEQALKQVRFDNDNAIVDPSARQVHVTVSDGEATSSPAAATIMINTGATTTIEKRIVSSADDVEQRTSNGNMYLNSSDLELAFDGSASQQVGLRFTALDIPFGAVITAAYIQFQTDERGTGAASLLIRGLDTDDASPFTNSYFNLSSRLTTSASASWQPQAWTILNEAGAAQRTPDLSALVQEIVNRTGWQAGNDLGLVISGSGTRTAESYEGGGAKAPLLHIEYTLSSPNTGEIKLSLNQAFRENVAGATAGTLSVTDPAPGQTYVFSVADARFEIVGSELKLKDGIRLDFERAPSINLDITATASGGGSFRDVVTAPVIDVPETRFAAFGDYGSNSGSAAVAQLVNSLAVDFIITAGDNAYGSTAIDDQIGDKYSSYIGNYQGAYGSGSMTNRFWPSIGNHDYDDGGGVTAYRNYFTLPGNELYYDFVIGPVHFFAIDSNSQQPDGRSSTSIQAQWLQSEIAASTSPYKIVYFHHTPYSSGNDHGSTTTLRWPFEQWGATAVLASHEHVYERVLRDDDLDGTMLPYFTTGLGGASRYGFDTPIEGSQVRFADDWGTMLIQASDDSITFEFIAITGGGAGTLIDTYTIDLPVQAAQAALGSKVELSTANEPTVFTSDIEPNFGAPLFRMGADPMSAFDLF